MAMALEPYKYKQSWLASAVKENDIDKVVHLLELGIRPTNDESLVDDALSAGNCDIAALLVKHGAPRNSQALGLVRWWKKWRVRVSDGVVDAARLALWEYLACNKESDLVRVRPLRRWAMLRHWVRMRAIFFYWAHLAAKPGSKTAERAAKRFKATANVLEDRLNPPHVVETADGPVTVSTTPGMWTGMTTEDVIKLKMKPANPSEFKDKQMSLTQKDVVFSSLYSDCRFFAHYVRGNDLNQVHYYVLARPRDDPRLYAFA